MDIWGKIIPGRENSKYKDTEIVEVLGVLKEQQGGHHVCCSVNMGRERKGMKSERFPGARLCKFMCGQSVHRSYILLKQNLFSFNFKRALSLLNSMYLLF